MTDEEKQGSTEELAEQSPIQQKYVKIVASHSKMKAAWENCRRELEIRNKDLHDFLAAMVDHLGDAIGESLFDR